MLSGPSKGLQGEGVVDQAQDYSVVIPNPGVIDAYDQIEITILEPPEALGTKKTYRLGWYIAAPMPE